MNYKIRKELYHSAIYALKYTILWALGFYLLWFWIVWWKYMYYEHMPLSTFIVVEKLDFQDYAQWDLFQVVYSYRDSKQDTMVDIYYKVVCNGIYNTDWKFQSLNVILEKTNWPQVKIVSKPIVLNLPKWECIIWANWVFDIRGHKRYLTLTDTFIVN